MNYEDLALEIENQINSLIENTFDNKPSNNSNATFKVDDDLKAEWCLSKIKTLNKECQRIVSPLDFKINILEAQLEDSKKAKEEYIKKYENEKNFFYALLSEYAKTIEMEEQKTQKKYTLPSGELISKKETEKIILKDEEKLINYFQNNGDIDYIEYKPVLCWKNLKQKLVIRNGQILNTETGEIFEDVGIAISSTNQEFIVKVK